MDGLTWNRAQTLFLQYLRHERNLSEETLRAYSSDLRQFAGYASTLAGGSAVELKSIGPEIIRGYLASVHRSLEKTSRARKLSALRSFYTYLNSAGIFTENPADQVAHPRIKQKMPSFPRWTLSFTSLTPSPAHRSGTAVPGERPATGPCSNCSTRRVSV